MKKAKPYNMEFGFLESEDKTRLFMDLFGNPAKNRFDFYFEFNHQGFLVPVEYWAKSEVGVTLGTMVVFGGDGQLARRGLVNDNKIWIMRNRILEPIRYGECVAFQELLTPTF